jgi:hypothetical protein
MIGENTIKRPETSKTRGSAVKYDSSLLGETKNKEAQGQT